ncbi:hypothetical protein [Pseudobacteroides cellulosolvens]|uniref:Uncharacterized protein n=1 Tax=Pseudobacteroides cellulosolvens ATCC 35603 = DSM 2933 TaxID=398512 RepID=A0A0L6JVX4_9FIRM|nr:hypothetical protein [Pseudobacteroides cellulosolvens]KNY30021.1 hypothetical protein Bccel_5298 [Pseudobacteroides cellulosolvens ATCC 35603 = DSM 2933]
MDEKKLNEAVENISLIKGVIDKTSKSFSAFSKIFIYWGMLFILNSIVTLFMIENKDSIFEVFKNYHFIWFILPVGIVALMATLIYRNISKKIPLVGLEKHLMKLWILILIMNIIPVKINVNAPQSSGIDLQTIVVQTSYFSTTLFSLAIALIVTSLFTGYKHLMKMGAVYIGISLINAYSNISFTDATIFQLLYSLALPFTFLYTGFYLKAQQARGEQLGYKFDS